MRPLFLLQATIHKNVGQICCRYTRRPCDVEHNERNWSSNDHLSCTLSHDMESNGCKSFLADHTFPITSVLVYHSCLRKSLKGREEHSLQERNWARTLRRRTRQSSLARSLHESLADLLCNLWYWPRSMRHEYCHLLGSVAKLFQSVELLYIIIYIYIYKLWKLVWVEKWFNENKTDEKSNRKWFLSVLTHTYCVTRTRSITSLALVPSTDSEKCMTLSRRPSTIAFLCLAIPTPERYLESASASAAFTTAIFSASARSAVANSR